jgi:hypothetical protein
MKYMIISDIHGVLHNLNQVIDIYHSEKCKKLLFLGDIPSYSLDKDEQAVINKLNELSNEIIAVAGNCDDNINNLLFNIPITNEIILNNKKIFMIHHNIYPNEYFLNKDYDIILYGHSHVAKIDRVGDKLFINPGSITKSRLGDNSFAIIDENQITIRNLDNEIINSYII